MTDAENHDKIALEVVLSVLSYSTCSVSMIILNKLVLFTCGLNYPVGLLFIQNCGAVFLISLGKHMNWIKYPDFSLEVAKKWIPLTLLFVSMLWTSMKSLHSMSVSTQTILKNLAVVLTAVGDSRLYGRRVTPIMYFSFVLMVVGSYLGARGDQWVTLWGLFWTLLNVAVTVGYTLYMKQLLGSVSSKIGRYGPVFYNNLLSLPFFLLASLPSMPEMIDSLLNASLGALFALLLMIVAGSAMTFAVFWCMKETSPTTFSVVGAVNKVPLAFLGIIVFNQFPTLTGYIGIIMALIGGFIYTYSNLNNSTKRSDNCNGPTVRPGFSEGLQGGALDATGKLKDYV